MEIGASPKLAISLFAAIERCHRKRLSTDFLARPGSLEATVQILAPANSWNKNRIVQDGFAHGLAWDGTCIDAHATDGALLFDYRNTLSSLCSLDGGTLAPRAGTNSDHTVSFEEFLGSQSHCWDDWTLAIPSSASCLAAAHPAKRPEQESGQHDRCGKREHPGHQQVAHRPPL
jgi:hypothetical protein